MKKYRLFILFPLLLILTMFLSACGIISSRHSDNHSQSFRQKSVITELDIAGTQGILNYISVGNGQICIVHGDDAIEHTLLEIYDIRNAKIISTTEIDSAVIGCRSFTDKTVLLYDYDHFYLFSPETLKVETLSVPDDSGQFSHDGIEYYYVCDDLLYRMDMKTEQSSILSNEYNLPIASIEGIHPENDLLSVSVYTSHYSLETALGILNPETGKFLALQDKFQQSPTYHGNSFYNIFYDDQTENSGIHIGTLSENGTQNTLLLPELQTESAPFIHFLESSNYAVVVQNSAANPEDYESQTELWRFDDSLQKCSLSDYGFNGALGGDAIYLPEADLIIGSYLDGDTFKTILVDPLSADFTDSMELQAAKQQTLIDASLPAMYRDETQLSACPANLTRFYPQIKELQDRYHVNILIGAHAQEALSIHGYKTELVESSDYIESALAELESVLQIYPADFFSQFQSENGSGGITFMLSGTFLNTQVLDIFDMGGFTDYIGNNYLIGINLLDNSLSRYAFHEIWHATEYKITQKDPNTFDSEKWDTMNPDGYDYTSFDIANDSNPNEWTLDNPESNGIYFVSSYGRTHPFEDRATLMEYVMAGDLPAEELLPEKPLYQKLEFMSDAIRLTFDTTDWGITVWEEGIR